MIKIKSFLKGEKFLYVLLALLSLLLACLSDNYDYDLYARLIVGEHFFKTGWIAYEDFLSYTPTHLWFDHEWGASIIFYTFFNLLGNFGLILAQAITMFFTVLFVIKTQRIQKHAYPTSLAFIALFLLLFSHQNPSIVRCHMFSFMFFSMLLFILEKTRKFNSNIIYLLPLLVLIWNNIHGGVVSGLGIVFIYMIGEILSCKPWKKYFNTLLISTPILAINPYGVDYLEFLLSANMKNRIHITEWWGVFVQRHVVYYYPIFCTSVFVILLMFLKLVQRKKICFTKILVLITTSILGVLHVKLLSLTLIAVSALYYNEIIRFIDKNGIRFLNKLAYVLISIFVFYIPFTAPTEARTLFTKYPVKEVEFIKQNKIEGNLITSFGLGSYTSFKLYPQNLIYMDGRYEEVYYDREFDNLIHYEHADEEWDNVLKYYNTQILMPEKNMPIYSLLKNNKDWVEIYTGEVCGVFLPKDKVKKAYIEPTNDINYYKKMEFKNFGKFGE